MKTIDIHTGVVDHAAVSEALKRLSLFVYGIASTSSKGVIDDLVILKNALCKMERDEKKVSAKVDLAITKALFIRM